MLDDAEPVDGGTGRRPDYWSGAMHTQDLSQNRRIARLAHMAAMIMAACEERPASKAILVVTDGYTGWPRQPVGPRVVACLTQAGTADSVPKWIDTVVLNPEEGR